MTETDLEWCSRVPPGPRHHSIPAGGGFFNKPDPANRQKLCAFFSRDLSATSFRRSQSLFSTADAEADGTFNLRHLCHISDPIFWVAKQAELFVLQLSGSVSAAGSASAAAGGRWPPPCSGTVPVCTKEKRVPDAFLLQGLFDCVPKMLSRHRRQGAAKPCL